MKSFDQSDIGSPNDCSLIREDRIVGNAHLNVAIRYAQENHQNGRMISKSLWNEILLYVSMQRQVHKAFDLVGVKNYSGKVVKVERGKESGRPPRILATQSKRDFWGVRTLEELLERMAIFHIENY